MSSEWGDSIPTALVTLILFYVNLLHKHFWHPVSDENLEVITQKSWLKTFIFFFAAGGSGALFKSFGVTMNFGVLLLHLI